MLRLCSVLQLPRFCNALCEVTGKSLTATPVLTLQLHTSTGSGQETPDQSAGPEAPLPESKPDLVERYLNGDVHNSKQKLKARLKQVVAELQRFPGDVGSSEVQVGVLTEKIRTIEQHFRQHKHDYQGMRGLRAWLNQRNSLMRYLRNENFERYCVVLQKLGLRDQFAKQARLDNYKVGTKLGDDTLAIDRYARGQHYPRQKRQEQLETQAARKARLLQLRQRRAEKISKRKAARELRQSVQQT